MLLEIFLGFQCALLLILISSKWHERRQLKLWRNGLIIAAAIYVVFVIYSAVWTQLSLELIGLFGYGILAILGHRYSPYLLAAGWILHVLWDLLLHYPTSSIAPQWYPGMCLGFDLAVGGYVAYLIYSKGLSQKKSTTKMN